MTSAIRRKRKSVPDERVVAVDLERDLPVFDLLLPHEFVIAGMLPTYHLPTSTVDFSSPCASDPGNPDMPNVIWGLKFDTGGDEDILVLSFDSPLPPVWGDIYMKDGTPGGAAWNAGFTLPDTDPLSAAANGSVNSHALVPDSTPIVPTPGAIVLAAAGSLLIAWLRCKGALA